MKVKIKTGSDRKIICCTFADDVQEFGEVIPNLALGYDPKNDSWFLTTNHDKNIAWPMKPERNLFEEADRAELDGVSKKELEAINERLENEVPDDAFMKAMKDRETIYRKTTCHHQDLLRFYEDAKKVGYRIDEDGDFFMWLWDRSARLIETGSPELPPLAAFGKK